ncbi:MAG TPA: M14 family zinc carboxypeptidase, partial [Bryobacteraceae bacterium]
MSSIKKLLLLSAVGVTSFAQQALDPDFARSVKEWTTRAEFSSPLVDQLPKAAGIPTPKDVLGYYVGAPKKLTRVAGLLRYYRALAAASPRVKILPAGTTDEGREQVVVAIADEDTIRNLDDYKRELATLADPRGASENQINQILARAKPIYMLTGGLHSAETGPPEMLMELAYRLVADQSPLFEQIRRNLIVMIAPVLEP